MDIIRQHKVKDSDFIDVLREPLGFKIPVSQERAEEFPEVFSYGYSEITEDVEYWVKHRLVGETETTVNSLNQGGVTIYQNATHSSSKYLLRPDTTGVKSDILVFKEEAKDKSSVLGIARNELIEKMHPAACKTYPFGLLSIPGFATSNHTIEMYSINFIPSTKSYSTELVRTYSVQERDGRVEFLVDVFKIIKWIVGLKKPNQSMHLIPGVRVHSPNGHFLTGTQAGLLLKKLPRERLENIRFDLLRRVYDAKLANVERGMVNCSSVTIQTIGRRARDALQNRIISRDAMIAQVRLAIDSLHKIGIAHCDVCLDNVFVLDSGEVILGDLEYCAEIFDQPPDGVKRRFNSELGVPVSAQELDEQQFLKLLEEF